MEKKSGHSPLTASAAGNKPAKLYSFQHQASWNELRHMFFWSDFCNCVLSLFLKKIHSSFAQICNGNLTRKNILDCKWQLGGRTFDRPKDYVLIAACYSSVIML